MKKIKPLANDLLHLFFPHNCEGCGTDILNDKSILCANCFLQLPETSFTGKHNNPVEKIFYGRIRIEHATALFYYSKDSMLQHLVTELKYHGNREIGLWIGRLMGQVFATSKSFTTIDAIVPLPLNPIREKKRGYNQAGLIAEGIQQVWSKPVITDALTRKVFTETQTHKDRITRWQTMQGVFEVTAADQLASKHILLIDDIVTTGATLESCGQSILNIPGTKLSIATTAYTV